jgi:hypothetical protein
MGILWDITVGYDQMHLRSNKFSWFVIIIITIIIFSISSISISISISIRISIITVIISLIVSSVSQIEMVIVCRFGV